MEFSLHALHRVDAELEQVLKSMRGHLKITDIEKMNRASLMKQNKDILVDFVELLTGVIGNSQCMLKSAAEELDALKNENMKLQNSTVCLQGELLQQKSDDLDSVKSTVETEIKSWAGVVQKSCSSISAVTPFKLKQAVKQAVSEEDRSSNFLIFGADEKISDEQLLADIFLQTDTKPEVAEYYRIGAAKDEGNRPIKVKLRKRDAVMDVLLNAKKLKGHASLGSIFISPDRSVEQRVAHSKLIDELKKKRQDDPSRHYYIKRGAICSAERTSRSTVNQDQQTPRPDNLNTSSTSNRSVRKRPEIPLSPFEQTVVTARNK